MVEFKEVPAFLFEISVKFTSKTWGDRMDLFGGEKAQKKCHALHRMSLLNFFQNFAAKWPFAKQPFASTSSSKLSCFFASLWHGIKPLENLWLSIMPLATLLHAIKSLASH